jgi:hypothetical protein
MELVSYIVPTLRNYIEKNFTVPKRLLTTSEISTPAILVLVLTGN